MILQVKVITNAREEKISRQGDFLKVKLTQKAEKGQANKALINLLSQYFKVAKSQVHIKKGEKSRIKRVEVLIY
ncbi:MAG: DUF167 domain-containing protein [Patescibacteria group bacterium]|nr:DUF167 domain-containing protein [Patescibacteria group bacterium]